ncbi:hypothetical protein B296_00028372 [Ensete ventricosum]|uniref:Uncharacterized protein n=1 Tax=Ensete ventricosum TaxID=4639 RepID=A0A426X8B4_ENSVE|nr:hypothetical protein B296_00028372 [Ensete ventricosum]
MESPMAPNREVQLEAEVLPRRAAEAHADSPTVVPTRSRSRSHDPVQASPDLDTLSSDSADSLREQVRQVHQRLDEVQKEILKSKGEVRESSKGGSPFTPEIQDKPLPANFKLLALELYGGNCDPAEHRTRTYPSWISVMLEQLSSLHTFHWKFRRPPSPLDYSVMLNNLCLVLTPQMHLLDCVPSPIQSPLHPSRSSDVSYLLHISVAYERILSMLNRKF